MKYMGENLYFVVEDTRNSFFQRVDECGGWPHNAKNAVYKHCCELKRPCYFSAGENIRDEYNTSIFSADEYYMWKLSDDAKIKMKLKIQHEIMDKIRALDVL